MKSDQHIDFLNSYSANTSVVPEVIEHLIDDLKKTNYRQDEIDEIVLSLDEALTNAIQETMKTNDSIPLKPTAEDLRDITVRYTITSEIFDATIIDHGKGFDIFNILNSTPRAGSRNYINQIINYATESEKCRIKVRLNGREIPLRGIGAGLKIILNFMDAVTIDMIDKETVLSQSVSESSDGTIFNMKRKKTVLMKDRFPIRAFDNREFLHSREARAVRIMSEYMEPEKRFKEFDIRHTVVFFGSARINPENDRHDTARYYHAAADLAFELASLSEEIKHETGSPIYICTGGGPGIMEAANMGAQRAGALTIGLNIELPFEQSPNKYISPELSFQFHYFFMRKLWFLYQAKAIVVFPGGLGTMDELFEVLTLVQTRKLEKMNFPIVLFGESFWREVINFEKLAEYGFIDPKDLGIFHYSSDVKECLDYLRPRIVELIRNTQQLAVMKFPL